MGEDRVGRIAVRDVSTLIREFVAELGHDPHHVIQHLVQDEEIVLDRDHPYILACLYGRARHSWSALALCGDLAEPVASAPTRSGAPVPLYAPLQVEDKGPSARIGIAKLRRSAVDSQFWYVVPHLGLQGLAPGSCIERTRCAEKLPVRAQPRLEGESRRHRPGDGRLGLVGANDHLRLSAAKVAGPEVVHDALVGADVEELDVSAGSVDGVE